MLTIRSLGNLPPIADDAEGPDDQVNAVYFDPREVLSGGQGGTDPAPRVPSPDHGDGIDFEPDDASGGVVIGTYDGSDDAAEIGSLSDASSGAGQGPAHYPLTAVSSPGGWSPPPQGGVHTDFQPPTPPSTQGHQDLFDAFGSSPSPTGGVPPGSELYGKPIGPGKPRTGSETA